MSVYGYRYVKLSRELSQTPWFIDGQRVGNDETSLEEEIVRHVLPHFRYTINRYTHIIPDSP